MKKQFRSKGLWMTVASVLLMLILAACGNGDNDTSSNVDWDFYTERAETFLLTLVDGDYDVAYEMLNPAMADALDVAGIQGTWAENIAMAGAFQSIYEMDHFAEDGHYFVLITSRHENSGMITRIAFDEDRLVGGWRILEFPTLEDVGAIETVGFNEYPVIIVEGTDFPINAMLSMPDDVTDQIPGVIIVGGSGSHNMDGSAPPIQPSPIYRDIAHYLAENGIAVLRHDRRLFTHGGNTAFGGDLTLYEELIEDALLAVEILRADPRIDPDRIYIVGHSLGAMTAPRIHAEADFAGLILLAGSPRHMLELLIEQSRNSISTTIELELASEDDLADIIAGVDELEELFNQLADLSDEEAQETIVPVFGGMAYYYLDMLRHPFETYVQDLMAPVLVMQPDRDFQILADVDFILLQELFADRDNVTFLLYEELNHMFIPSAATNFIEHAESVIEGGQVDRTVLQDIVAWILGQ